MTDDNKNFLIAMVLCVGIFVLWNTFYLGPQLEQQQRESQTAPQQSTQEAPLPNSQPNASPGVGLPGNTAAAAVQPRDVVAEQTPRVEIETPVLTGSINLKGARLDDLQLTAYTNTVDPDSGAVSLLNPAGSINGYFAENGWLAANGTSVNIPGPDTVWSAKGNVRLTPSSPITLTWDNGEGLSFSRTFEIDDQYMFSVTQEVRNDTGQALALFPYARIRREGTPRTEGIFVLHEGLVGVFGDELQEYRYDDVEDAETPPEFNSTGGWTGITDKYWAVALIPDQQHSFVGHFSSYKTGSRLDYQSDFLSKDGLAIPAGETVQFNSKIFAGAKVVQTIDTYQNEFNIRQFELLIDWGWFYFITKPLYWLIHFIQEYVGNYGVAILLATVVVKLVFLPLANKSYASMAKMKGLQPEIEKLRERYSDDKMKIQQEMMELYKKEKVSPLSGCLPILVQIPVFFALYKVLYVTIDMRHAPFFGWIKDLSAQDPTSIFNLFGLIPWSPPSFLLIGVLPIIMGVTMWIQMRLNPPPPDPTQAMIFNWMPLFFTFLLGTFPAGLVLYWAWNNFLSILQQYAIMRHHGVEVDLLGNIKQSLKLGKKPQKPAE